MDIDLENLEMDMDWKQMYMELSTFLAEQFPESVQEPEGSAVDIAIRLLTDFKKQQVAIPELPKSLLTWTASVYYHNGIAPKFLQIPEFVAATPDEAQKIATAKANQELGDGNWRQVRIMPKSSIPAASI